MLRLRCFCEVLKLTKLIELNTTDNCLRPVRGEMFIACNAKHPLSFGGAGVTGLLNRNCLPLLRTEKIVLRGLRGYKHFTPTGVRRRL